MRRGVKHKGNDAQNVGGNPTVTWPNNTREAAELQRTLRSKVLLTNKLGQVRLVAGVDVSYERVRREGYAGIILLKFPEFIALEQVWAREEITFPYVPGLLSFREGPLVLKAFEKLTQSPDLTFFDGQGVAHPRGFGLASHMGVILGIPSIGVAKSHLYGSFSEPPAEPGNYSPLLGESGQVIGAALRTKRNVKPIFVSVGHMVDLTTAIRYVLACCRGYRLPEPTRRAHLLVQRLRTSSPPP